LDDGHLTSLVSLHVPDAEDDADGLDGVWAANATRSYCRGQGRVICAIRPARYRYNIAKVIGKARERQGGENLYVKGNNIGGYQSGRPGAGRAGTESSAQARQRGRIQLGVNKGRLGVSECPVDNRYRHCCNRRIMRQTEICGEG